MPNNPLRKKPFYAFFTAQFCNVFNDNILKNAIIILFTYQIGMSSQQSEASLVAAASGLFILPFLLFSTVGGQLADKYDKARLIRIIKSSEVFIILIGSVSFYFQHIYFLLFTLFLMGTHSTFFGPIKFSIIPELLASEQLNKGNAIVEASTFLAILFGTILGGILIVGQHGIYAVSLLMLVVAITGLSVSFLMPTNKNINHQVTISKNIFKESLSILKITTQYPGTLSAIIGISWFWLIGATFVSLFPVYTKEIIGAEAYLVTLFFIIFSAGVALGSLTASKIKYENIYKTSGLALIIMSISIIDLFINSQALNIPHITLTSLTQFTGDIKNWRILLDLLLISCSGGLYVVPLYTILQTKSPSSHCARFIACNNIMNSLFIIGSAIFAMALFAIGANVLQLFLIIALMNIGIGLIFLKPRQIYSTSSTS